MHSQSEWAIAILGAFLLAGCLGDKVAGGTGVGNPTKGSVTVALVADDSPAAKAAAKGSAIPRNPDGSFDIADAGGTIFNVRSSFANVGRIKIALPAGLDCSDADETGCEAGEVKVEGPFVADLMSGTWSPDPGAQKIPVGAYNKIEIRLESQKVPYGKLDLSGHSFILSGVFTYAGRGDRPFSIGLDFDEEARFESDSGFTVKGGASRLSVVLDIAQWLSQADITGCLDSGGLTLDTLGGFAMDSSKGCGLEKSVKEAVKGSGKLHGESLDD